MDKKKAAAHFKKAILLSYLSPRGTVKEKERTVFQGEWAGCWEWNEKRKTY
jgi:hypothetical protein